MIKIEIDNWKLTSLAKKNPDLYLKLKELDPELKSLPDALEDKGWASFSGYVNNIEDLPDEIFEIVTFHRIKPLQMFETNGRIDMNNLKDAFISNQVHLPGNELLRIREVKVETDPCTDYLCEELKAGWKILAVCVQTGQRRPDYVLGKE